jgi:undecaprenyl-diphosphatase
MNDGLNFFLPFFAKFSWLGNWLFLLIALIECVPFAGVFIPGGTLIMIGGLLASRGYFNPLNLIIFASLGAIIGDYLGYCSGRWGGNWLESKNIIKKETLEKGLIFFVKYGNKSIFWGRFIGATRAIMPFTAGASKMKTGPFLLWASISSIVFISFNVLLGYFSGSLIGAIIQKWSSQLGLLIFLLVVAGLAYWLIRKHGENVWEYFKKQSRIFTDKLMASRWFKYLDERYPAIDELPQPERNKEFIYGFFLWVILLSTIYLTALILNLF